MIIEILQKQNSRSRKLAETVYVSKQNGVEWCCGGTHFPAATLDARNIYVQVTYYPADQ